MKSRMIRIIEFLVITPFPNIPTDKRGKYVYASIKDFSHRLIKPEIEESFP